MSYILDALRKADAERERGAVPTLSTHNAPSPGTELEPARRARLPWLIAGVAVVLLVATLAWFLAGRGSSVDAPAPMVLPTAPMTRPEATRPPLPAPPAEPVNTLPAVAETLPPAAPPPRAAMPVPRKGVAESASAPAASVARATASAPAAASATEARLPTLRELPEDVRRQIPALAIGGSMYSKDASSRMLIVNGQLLHEGDEVAPGLRLEQIRLKAAVLRFQQQRFEITY